MSSYDRSEIPTITRRRHVLACARCRTRRVRCDRAQPTCTNCTKAGVVCTPAQPSNKRDNNFSRTIRTDDEGLRGPRDLEGRSPSRDPSSLPSPGDPSEARVREIQGKLLLGEETRYFSPLSWPTVAEEVSRGMYCPIGSLLTTSCSSLTLLQYLKATLATTAPFHLRSQNHP